MDKTCTDKVLSEAVREFPVIYDKSKSGYKDRLIISNAWKDAKKCYLEDENLAKKLFENLKKRFNKCRKAVREINVSGTSRAVVDSANQKLAKMAYLSWLEAFVLLRNTITNCPTFRPTPSSVTECDVNISGNESEDDDYDKSTVDNSPPNIDTDPATSTGKKRINSNHKENGNKKVTSEVTGRPQWHQKSKDDNNDAQLKF